MAIVASTVSSKMIEAMSHTEGFRFSECLTGKYMTVAYLKERLMFDKGFKYIGNTALELERQGYEVLFGYEEAIGYMFGNILRDKDGVAASVRMAFLLHAKFSIRTTCISDLYCR